MIERFWYAVAVLMATALVVGLSVLFLNTLVILGAMSEAILRAVGIY